jgi:hypothetical protein
METILIIIKTAIIALLIYLLVKRVQKLYNIALEPFPIVMGRFIIILIALIAFIFGIHTDIFSSYDRIDNQASSSYNWFSSTDIVKFPIDQYRMKQSVFPDVNSLIELDSCFSATNKHRKYTIVVDKTKSTEPNEQTSKISSHIKELFKEELNNHSSCNNSFVSSNLTIEDLFVLFALRQLSKETEFETKVDIIYYLGDNIHKPVFEEDVAISGSNFCTNAKKFVKFINTIKDEDKGNYTNFTAIIKNLQNKKHLGEETDHFSNVILISDFIHDIKSGSPFSKLSENLNFFENVSTEGSYINQVNLVQVPNNNIEDSRVIEMTKGIFRGHFNHIYFYEFFEEETFFKENPFQVVSKIFSTVDKPNNQHPLIFYHSEEDVYKGEIEFTSNRDKSKNLILGIMDGFSAYSQVSSSYLIINNSKISPYVSEQFKFQCNKRYPIHISTKNENTNNFVLEVSEPLSTHRINIPIRLKKVLPSSISLYLILFYSLFSVCIISLLLYFLIKLFRTSTKHKVHYIFYIILFLFIIISIVPSLLHLIKFYFIQFNYKDCQHYIFILLFILVLVSTISLFRYSLRVGGTQNES